MQMRPLHILIESNIVDNIRLLEQEFIWGMEWGLGNQKIYIYGTSYFNFFFSIEIFISIF